MKALVAVNETDRSEQVLSLMQHMMREPEQVVLVHVLQPEDHTLRHAPGMGAAPKQHAGRDQADPEKIMSFYKKRLNSNGHPNIAMRVRTGTPSLEILKAAREEAVDLIIVGCDGRSRFQRFISGSVTKEVERNATVPVLVSKRAGGINS